MTAQHQQTEFGKRLLRARMANNVTAAQLASECCVSKQMVAYWENGRFAPSNEKLALICAALGVSADFMLFGHKSKTWLSEILASQGGQP